MKTYLATLILVLIIVGTVNGQTIRFVSPSGAGLKNGTSWSHAYDSTQLQTAIDATGVTEVWVAAGTYKPTTGINRSKYFQMKNGVAIYGGFAGGETSLGQRNWEINLTILSGDIGVLGDYSDNSYHVIYNPDLDPDINSSAILDGFNVSAGSETSFDGGFCNISSSPTLANCIISNNKYGGIYNDESSPTLTNCKIISNRYYGINNRNGSSPAIINCTLSENSGRGIENYSYSSPTLTNCTISNNSGSGVYNSSNSSPILTNCTISENSTSYAGGGIYNSQSSPRLINCLIANNYAEELGGGIYNYSSSSPILTNCTISENVADEYGGGLYNENSLPTFYNSIIWGNRALINGKQIHNYSGTVTLSYSCYGNGTGDVNNEGTFSPDANCITANPLIIEPNNDFRLSGGSPCVDKGNDALNNETCDIRGVGFGRKLLKTDAAQTGPIDMGAYEYKRESDPETPKVLRIYVKSNTTGANDGSSWENAYTSLQTAIAAAGRYYEIWVAAGTYKPTTGTDREISFQMKNFLAVYGGFAGTETILSQRNSETNVTILSGDLNGDDVVTGSGETLSFSGISENSYRVVRLEYIDNTAILDGFTIKGGNTTNSGNIGYPGGGVFISHSSLTLSNCTITENYSYHDGGGLAIEFFSSPILTNCIISRNKSDGYLDKGGGLCIYYSSSPKLYNCTITGNRDCDNGGGIYVGESSSPVLTNCTISMNYASYGGGMYNESSSPKLINCAIVNNSVSRYGGGVYNYSSSPTITNCTLTGNFALDFGGGWYNTSSSSPILNNSIVWGNSTLTKGSQIYNTSSMALNYSCYANTTGDIYNAGTFSPDANCITANPNFIDPNNDFRISGNSPCADAGNNALNNETTDFRGVGFGRKLLKIDASQSGTIDMGAFEFNKAIDPEIPKLLRIYVKNNATGANDGSSWANAYTSLQSAIVAAERGYEIWVAAGTYKPTTGTDRTISFNMKRDLAIYGGFDGTETSLDQRNWTTNVTILSGDIYTEGVKIDNSYHVISNKTLNNSSILDGFTIQDGYGSEFGGGIYNENSSSPTLSNLIVTGNSATDGGGIYNKSSSSPVMTNCVVTSNKASSEGGGIYNESSSPKLSYCIISGDSAHAGGGMYNYSSSSPELIKCTISQNTAVYSGGGIYNQSSSNPTLYSCVISENSSIEYGGGLSNSSSSPILTNCSISGNSVVNNGGGVYNSNSASTMLTNCMIVLNSSKKGGAIYNTYSAPTLTNCTLSENFAKDYGGGIYNESTAQPKLNNSIIWGNSTLLLIGNQIYNTGTSAVLTLNYSCYANGTGDVFNSGILYTDANNITSNPNFIDPNNDFRLADGSPCADAGIDSLNHEPTDIRGEGFIRKLLKTDASQAGPIDMGAYEYKKGSDPETPELLRIYVKNNATGTNDGSSWENAFTSLQQAITVAGKGYEIWVAAGTYKPTTGSDRTISFNMKRDLAIYGGFAGTETLFGQRNWKDNLTVLSGDIGTVGVNTDNSYNVVRNVTLNNSAILDGFTIRDGYGSSNGGGIYNESSSSPTLSNLIITGNSASDGGGIYNKDSSNPTIRNCVISENTASSEGGGIYNTSSSPKLTNCLIVINSAFYGGGVYNGSTSSPTLANCTISGNSSVNSGGGLYNSSTTSTIKNSIIWGNSATKDGKQLCNYSTIKLYSSCYGNGTGDVYNSSTFTPDANCITVNPKLINPTSDFRILNTSPCADAGIDSINNETNDIRGAGFGRKLLKTDHSQAGTIDMGAYEFNEGTDPGNPTLGGEIEGLDSVSYGSAHPGITSKSLPTGHVGILEYKWQQSTISETEGFIDIASSNSETYMPGILTTTTWFKRLARVNIISDWEDAAESNVIKITVVIPATLAGEDREICMNTNTQIGMPAITGSTYQWSSVPSSFISTEANPVVSPKETTIYILVRTITASSLVNTDSVTVTVNPLPAALAGPDRKICQNSNTQIGASGVPGSSYNWISIPAGFSSTVSNPVVSPIVTTTYILIETSASGCSNTDSISVTINRLPIANAGSDQTVSERSLVMLNGSASSDPDGDPFTYLWTAPSEITLNSNTLAQPSFMAPIVTSDTSFTISLVVNDGTCNSATDEIVVAVTTNAHFQTVWNGNGFDHMNINVVTAQLDKLDLVAGDEIGIFDGAKCVGFGILAASLSTSNILPINVSRDDGSGNGYIEGDTITYIIYDKSLNKEFSPVTAIYYHDNPDWVSDGKFAVKATAFVELSSLSSYNQQISLTSGWNIISTNVIPADINLMHIVQPLIDDNKLKKVMDESGRVIEDWGTFGGWQNSIGNIASSEGYKINVNELCTLSIEGIAAILPMQIDLNAGWNLIGFPAQSAQDGIAVVQQLIDTGNLKKVMNESGNTIEDWGIFGGWQNNIGDFKPGKGYAVNVLSDCSFTVSESVLKSVPVETISQSTQYFIPCYQGNGFNHMNFNFVNLSGVNLQAVDEIAVFDGLVCVGAGAVNQNNIKKNRLSIPASCHDGLSSKKNGFIPGNRISVKIFHQGKIIDTNLGDNKIFEEKSSVFIDLSLIAVTESIQLTDNLLTFECYPNPFSDHLMIDLKNFNACDLDIAIFDISGRIVKQLYKGISPAQNIFQWNRDNSKEVMVAPGVYFCKVNEMVKKIICINQ